MVKIVKKKRWFNIVAPELFKGQLIGQTYLGDVPEAVGRSVSVNMSTLIGDSSRQNSKATFIITGANGENLQTSFVKFQIVPSALKKMVKRNRSKIDDSYTIKLTDAVAKFKIIIITKSNARGKIEALLFKVARAWVAMQASRITFEQLLIDSVQKKFTKALQRYLSRIYPVTVCEVRYLEKLAGEAAEIAVPIKPDNEVLKMMEQRENEAKAEAIAKAPQSEQPVQA